MKNWQIKPILEALSSIDMNQSMPLKFRYARQKSMAALAKELEILDKTRVEICERFAEKKEDGTFEMVDNDGSQEYKIKDKESFSKEINELFNQDVEISLHTVKIDDFQGFNDFDEATFEKINLLIE